MVDLPPGLSGNPQAVPACSEDDLVNNLASGLTGGDKCPLNSQVGFIELWLDGANGTPGNPVGLYYPVFNVQAPAGTPAVFGFNVTGSVIHISGGVRSGTDYGVRTITKDISQFLPLAGVTFTVWGVPADPAHDADRGRSPLLTSAAVCADPSAPPSCTNPSTAPVKPFLSLPTSCTGPTQTDISATGWQGGTDLRSFLSHDNFGSPIGGTGCGALDFSPTLQARPTTSRRHSFRPGSRPPRPSKRRSERQRRGPPQGHHGHPPRGHDAELGRANGLDGCSAAHSASPALRRNPSTPPPIRRPAQTPPRSARWRSTPHSWTTRSRVRLRRQAIRQPVRLLFAIYMSLHDPTSRHRRQAGGQGHPDPDTGQLTTSPTTPSCPSRLQTAHLRRRRSAQNPRALRHLPDHLDLTPWSAA